jgi:UDP-glucose 4-epimerase
MRILITGASGYLAQAFALMLRELGEEVVLASRMQLPQEKKVAGCDEVLIDFSNSDSILKALKGVDAVIHCAGLNSASSVENPNLAEEINAENTRVLVERSIGQAKTFVYISTIHVYASELCGTITESSITSNQHPYATSHLHGEYHVQSNSRKFPAGAFNIRLANTFGIPIQKESSAWDLVINQLCKQAILERKLLLRSNPNTIRNFIPVSTATRNIFQLLKKFADTRDTNCFNVGSSTNLSLNQIVEIISNECQKLFGFQVSVHYEMDSMAEKQEFDFRSEYSNFQDVDFEKEISLLLVRTKEIFS